MPLLSDDEFEAHADALQDIDSLELYVLKAHLLVEVALKTRLTQRLCATEHELPQLPFDTLARLALVGLTPNDRPVLTQARLLNRMRNEFAHRIEPEHYLPAMRDFVLQGLGGGPWPRGQQAQLTAFRGELSRFLGYLQALAGFRPVLQPQTVPRKPPRFSQAKDIPDGPGEH